MLSRRALLASTAAVVGTGGCLGRLETGDRQPATTTLEPGDRVRAEGEPISYERTLDEGGLEYFESNDTIRYPEKKSGERIVEYGTIGIDESLSRRAGSLSHWPVSRQFEPPLDSREFVELHNEAADDGSVRVVILWVTASDESGEFVGEPDIGIPELVDRAPRTVAVTVEQFDERTTREFPVYVEWIEGTKFW